MIDEKKLIEEFRKCHISFNGTPMEESDMMISYRSLVRVINKQPKVGEWIPCSERLPKDNEKSNYYDAVIVTLDNGRVVNGCYRNIDEEWWVDAEDGEKYSINVTGHVIAWMPLPASYKEDMRDGKND